MEKVDDADTGYSTVLSTAVSICDKNSRTTYKKANECSADELINEVHRQIKESIFHDLPDDYKAIINPNNYYDTYKNKWACKDNAYFNVYSEKYIPFNSSINNLYNLGTHNGKSYISYTTIESAVSNAIYLSGELYLFNLNSLNGTAVSCFLAALCFVYFQLFGIIFRILLALFYRCLAIILYFKIYVFKMYKT